MALFNRNTGQQQSGNEFSSTPSHTQSENKNNTPKTMADPNGRTHKPLSADRLSSQVPTPAPSFNMQRNHRLAPHTTAQKDPNPGKNIYSFEEGEDSLRHLLGGKGTALAEMTNLGLPVPAGFTITTETCDFFLREDSIYPENFQAEIEEHLEKIEKSSGRIFGDPSNPLLLSVRSGAAISMPGMMDTVLNLGLNDQTVLALINKTQNARFAYDAYRRFIHMFGNVVLGIPNEKFENQIEVMKSARRVSLDTDLTELDLRELVGLYKGVVVQETGKAFPEEPSLQLRLAIEAVFRSWNSDRARTYRRINGIYNLKGTAVTVQAMVFGNMGETSATGVLFTRDPSTGEKILYGEYLVNAQGEDVVAGIRTPEPIENLRNRMPELYDQLIDIKDKLEQHYLDMQDIEFTIEEGKLYFLQTRTGKRTAQAAVKIATDLVREGLVNKEDALLKIDAKALSQLLHPYVDPKAKKEVIAIGLPASPGGATGAVVFTADDAVRMHEAGQKVILVRKETSPEDIHGMHVAQGILTSTGGMTSHASVVARAMGKCCVAGCAEIIIDKKDRKFVTQSGVVIQQGDVITLNGTTGEVILGEIPMLEPTVTGDFELVLNWAEESKELEVRANADTAEDVLKAIELGATGVGLCRTEHMFFSDERIALMRQMILAHDLTGRARALTRLMPMQKQDFKEIFMALNGLPITIRLLDPPLHEFLPHYDRKIAELASVLGVEFEVLKHRVEELSEINPMLGHRGCRLAITYPEIYQMQVQAILEAAIECTAQGIKVNPAIEIPLVSNLKELEILKSEIQEVIKDYEEAIKFDIQIGAMIELPRACLTADELAEESDFFAFGTNDLTQTTFGLSRDDANKFIPEYLEQGILLADPADSIDLKGVGELMQIAINRARSTKPGIEFGICGEHGADPASIQFCHDINLDFVSCSPFRVPIARLAAAQASIVASRRSTFSHTPIS